MEKLVSPEALGHRDDLGLSELVWVKGTPSIALQREEFRVHRGPRPPVTALGSPSAVVCCLEGSEQEEDIASLVRSVKEEVPEAAIVVLSPTLELQLVYAAVSGGARGFLYARIAPHQLARAISVVLAGEMALPRELLEAWVEWLDQHRGPDLSTLLSERRLEILELVAEGLSNVQIARKLFVSESTVKQHLRAAYKILGVKNRREARRIFYQAQPAR
jgi:DNA-binding NarL/FixJ family response regulator